MAKPENKEHNILLADINPSLLLNGETPRLIDEWQLAPMLWDAVIHLINGSYCLVEIKLGWDNLIQEGAENLIKLKNKIDTEIMNNPSFVIKKLAKWEIKKIDFETLMMSNRIRFTKLKELCAKHIVLNCVN